MSAASAVRGSALCPSFPKALDLDPARSLTCISLCTLADMPLDGCAPGAAGPGDDSPVVWGRVRSFSLARARAHDASPAVAPRHSQSCCAVLTQCSHYFHLMCITTWLHNKNTCPICRRKWEFASAPKPAPATPGNRGFASGFAVAEAAAPVED